MSTVSISPIVSPPTGVEQYRATADEHESFGITPGAALDALTAQLGQNGPRRLVVSIEPWSGEALTPGDRQRLDELKKLYRLATTGRGSMTVADRAEMERLFDLQFAASERRAVAGGSRT